MASPTREEFLRRRASAPTGFAFLHSMRFWRRSGGKGLGQHEEPVERVQEAEPRGEPEGKARVLGAEPPPEGGTEDEAHAEGGARGCPKERARLSAGVTSLMYAKAVVTLAEVMPESTRPRKSQRTVGASAITT